MKNHIFPVVVLVSFFGVGTFFVGPFWAAVGFSYYIGILLLRSLVDDVRYQRQRRKRTARLADDIIWVSRAA